MTRMAAIYGIAALAACAEPTRVGECRDLAVEVSRAVDPVVSWTPEGCGIWSLDLDQAGAHAGTWRGSTTRTSSSLRSRSESPLGRELLLPCHRSS